MTATTEKNRLESGMLHRTMVLFQRAAGLPVGVLLLLAGTLALLVAIGWVFLRAPWPVATAAGIIYFLFLLADAALFWLLPRHRLSFGPWQAQAAVLSLPRAAGAFFSAFLLNEPGWEAALGVHLAFQLLGSVLLYWGAVLEPFRLSLTRLELSLHGLPPTAPLRLLHISDLHVERLTRREAALLQLVEEARPDLILLTGDYVNLSYNEDPVTHRQVRHLLRRLEAPHGVYATLGSPPVDLPDIIPALFEDLPVRLLRDEWVRIGLSSGREVLILGLDCTHHLDHDGRRLAQLVEQAPNGVPRVLLYHSPELMPQAITHGLDLYLCGHTHGGQVRLPWYGALITSSQLGRRYVMGHYREGDTNLYVSRGVGLEGLSAPRVRFLSPPEITLITITATR